MNSEERYNLITKNLQEVLGDEELKQKLSNDEQLKIYWGTSPTGKPHVGYLVPLIKLAHFLKAGCRVIVLFADLHAYLDSMKSTWDLLEYRTTYYEVIIKKVLQILGVDTGVLFFVRGTKFQLSERYTLDMYKLLSKTTVHKAQKAGAEVVKQSDNPLMSSLIYPILQALDEQYLDADAEFGGVDQRKIFTLSQEMLPTIGYKKRIHLMNPMIPSFTISETNTSNSSYTGPMSSPISTPKMSSTDPNSKIDLLDSIRVIDQKVNKAFCEEGNLFVNPLLVFCKYVIFPVLELKGLTEFIIHRPEKYGGDAKFTNYEDLEKLFGDKQLHPGDLKKGVREFLANLLAPLREMFESDKELQLLIKKAYPTF